MIYELLLDEPCKGAAASEMVKNYGLGTIPYTVAKLWNDLFPFWLVVENLVF